MTPEDIRETIAGLEAEMARLRSQKEDIQGQLREYEAKRTKQYEMLAAFEHVARLSDSERAALHQLVTTVGISSSETHGIPGR